MRVIEIIESRRWVNKQTGQTASIYGAVPWTIQNEKNHWCIETIGYTWKMSNGTVGLGRRPAETYEEARKIADAVNQLTKGGSSD